MRHFRRHADAFAQRGVGVDGFADVHRIKPAIDGQHLPRDVAGLVAALSDEDVDKLTDWILDFNFSTRKPLGLTMPDLYLDEEKILVSTVNVYCHRIAEFLAYMIENQSKGRDEVAEWATKNFLLIYAKAYADALKAKDSN